MSAPTPRPATGIDVPPITLGPDLPVTVFHSTERWHPDRIGALAVYCSDGRWGEAFDEFCRLREAGEPVDPDEFCLRYPARQYSLRLAIEAQIVRVERP